MRFVLERRGLLLVLSAPSGGGKSAVLKQLLAHDDKLGYSVSFTSRAPRGNEVNGKDFHFVTRAEFEAMSARDAFYEYAEVHGNLYGTSAEVIESALARNQDIALDVDIQGGLNIKRRLPDAVLVFLMPPSMSVLESRLRKRASDAEDQIRIRLNNAKKEIEHWSKYDFVVINEVLEDTVATVAKILHAERNRSSRFTMMQFP
ncbi:guanylate kinase [Candidatus Sumerlaeota bacterium]|nr:guanylate kinase [Candidatus Sumerlaeota bacterium]MBI3737123.1 guanylate kinase [Candidatus Sumerlaeota bacterium]